MKKRGISPLFLSGQQYSLLKQQLKKLNYALYAKEKQSWQGGGMLWVAVVHYQETLDRSQKQQGNKKPQALEPLYYGGVKEE
jgi:hypothetical protein